MDLIDSCFLCLDLGTSAVRGIAHRVRGGALYKSAEFSIDSYDTVFAIKSVVDELEHQIGRRFDTAYVTGNFGNTTFDIAHTVKQWSGEHRVTADDILAQISGITPSDGYTPLHLIPLQYEMAMNKNANKPIGLIDNQMRSAFGLICCPHDRLSEIYSFMRRAHIQPIAIFEPQFLQSATLREKGERVLFLDMGAAAATASIWTDRGPLWYLRNPGCGTEITNAIAENLNLSFNEAERIKRSVTTMVARETARFTPADAAYAFSHADINEIAVPKISEIISNLRDAGAPYIERYKPTRIVLTGGMSGIEGIADYITSVFDIPCTCADADATIRALSDFIWRREAAHVKAFIARRDKWNRVFSVMTAPFGIFGRRRKKRNKRRGPIPIMPSTLAFDMYNPNTYAMFASAGLSLIHVDIMDGLFAGTKVINLDLLKHIRASTRAHLHVHLMTESPVAWAAGAVAAGANTVLVSAHTAGVRAAVRGVRAAGCRGGYALAPTDKVSILTPEDLRDLDEVMVMTVTPGAAGQEFQMACLDKISELAALRKRLGLHFLISADGGINSQTAQLCWDAGADLLVSGSYLARSTDLPLAVQGLLKRKPDQNR